MSRLLCVLCLLTLFPFAANATSISSSSIVNTSCSGALTTSLLDGASFACAGNFTLDGGSITSDSVINISADGDLFLDNLTFTAPNISVSGLTGVKMGNNVVLNGSSAITIASGKTSVPTVIIQARTQPTVKWPYLDILQGGGGAVVIIGDGGDLNMGAGSGYVLKPSSNIPVVGGALIIGSGGIITTGSAGTELAVNVTSVPEPSTYAFMLLGLGLILLKRRV